MIDRQVKNFTGACTCGSRAHLYERSGDRARVYFVECSACGVRTGAYPTAAEAIEVWRQHGVTPIQFHRATRADPARAAFPNQRGSSK